MQFCGVKLIRELNLSPKDSINSLVEKLISDDESPLAGGGAGIMERWLEFANLAGGVPSVTVEVLGHFAGQYKIKHSRDARMFHFFFESPSNKDPVVIWLTGGQGCRSELAMFYENGPFSIANNLMTQSFVSYVELKKQAEKSLKSENQGVEKGHVIIPTDKQKLSEFFKQVDPSKMEEINSLLIDLQNLYAEKKSTHSAKVLRRLRDRMDACVALVLRKVKTVKSKH